MPEREPLITFKDPSEYKKGDILIPSETIDLRMQEMSKEVAAHYEYGQKLLVVGLMLGAAWTLNDLIKNLHKEGLKDLQVDYMKVKSYHSGTTAEHAPRIEEDLHVDPAGRHIIIVDDLIDTGWTADYVVDSITLRGAASVRTVFLLDKHECRDKNVKHQPDHSGFKIPPIWAQGHGMDSDEFGRADPNVIVGPYYYDEEVVEDPKELILPPR